MLQNIMAASKPMIINEEKTFIESEIDLISLDLQEIIKVKNSSTKEFDNETSFLIVNKTNSEKPISPVDLYLISEKSIWKNQVQQTRFLVYFELDFYCLCINFEIDFCRLKIQFVELKFFNLIFQNSSTDQQGEKCDEESEAKKF